MHAYKTAFISTVNYLRLFVVVYKLVNLVCRCGVRVMVLYMYAVLYAHRNCYSEGICSHYLRLVSIGYD